jgi:thioredoxin-related protein
MMKIFLITAAILATTVSGIKAQVQKESPRDTAGIQFEHHLKWSEILVKSKMEHKYIFVDCYATWCGPCKLMDATVYPQKEVGDVYNKDFISVRVQMDQRQADNEQAKSWYKTAKMLETDYSVSVYPTFLVFDPDGKPVHKVSGALNAKDFIQLAADAQNPDKQYYVILKNFQSGKLDTADEKGLAWAFANSDKELARKIAADYLTRIPRSRLKLRYSGGLMQFFQDDPRVFAVAMNYLNSLNIAEFQEEGNLNIVRALIGKPEVQATAIAHLRSLSYKEMCLTANLKLMQWLSRNIRAKEIADDYINRVPEDSLYIDKNIRVLFYFTQKTRDRGFKIFYAHSDRVDNIMKGQSWMVGKWEKGNAHGIALEIINEEEFKPLFIRSEKAGVDPDFDSVRKVIAKMYNTKDAEAIVLNAKVNWYNYLANDKKMLQYWPQLIQAKIDQEKALLKDSATMRRNIFPINQICWDIYLHSDDPVTINFAVAWMQQIAKDAPYYALDTYASLLYKSGQIDQAIAAEGQALKVDLIERPAEADNFRSKIEAMKRGDKIWLEAAYQ